MKFGQAVSDKKIFEIVDDGRTTTDDGRTDAGPWSSYKLTLSAFGSGELIKRYPLYVKGKPFPDF